jgi:hypothetical protein
MKLPILLASVVAAASLCACERSTVVNPPVAQTPAPAAVPVPVPGPPGPQGQPGKPGDTVIIAPDAAKPAETPPPAASSPPTQ